MTYYNGMTARLINLYWNNYRNAIYPRRALNIQNDQRFGHDSLNTVWIDNLIEILPMSWLCRTILRFPDVSIPRYVTALIYDGIYLKMYALRGEQVGAFMLETMRNKSFEFIHCVTITLPSHVINKTYIFQQLGLYWRVNNISNCATRDCNSRLFISRLDWRYVKFVIVVK